MTPPNWIIFNMFSSTLQRPCPLFLRKSFRAKAMASPTCWEGRWGSTVGTFHGASLKATWPFVSGLEVISNRFTVDSSSMFGIAIDFGPMVQRFPNGPWLCTKHQVGLPPTDCNDWTRGEPWPPKRSRKNVSWADASEVWPWTDVGQALSQLIFYQQKHSLCILFQGKNNCQNWIFRCKARQLCLQPQLTMEPLGPPKPLKLHKAVGPSRWVWMPNAQLTENIIVVWVKTYSQNIAWSDFILWLDMFCSCKVCKVRVSSGGWPLAIWQRAALGLPRGQPMVIESSLLTQSKAKKKGCPPRDLLGRFKHMCFKKTQVFNNPLKKELLFVHLYSHFTSFSLYQSMHVECLSTRPKAGRYVRPSGACALETAVRSTPWRWRCLWTS